NHLTFDVVRRTTRVSGVALLAAAMLLAVTSTTNARAAAQGRDAANGKIQHVVVIFQENRSFDEVLGAWCKATHRCDGYVGPVRLANGQVVPMTKSPDVVTPDPPHSVAAQTTAIDGGRMDGWGSLGFGCTSPGPNNCLTYYEPSQIPSLAAYANKYVVSDRT